MTVTSITLLCIVVAAAIFLLLEAHNSYEAILKQMLVTAIFRYRTDCYMKGYEPAFDLDVIQKQPWWALSYKHMLPLECYTIIKPYMEELKNDPRFYS